MNIRENYFTLWNKQGYKETLKTCHSKEEIKRSIEEFNNQYEYVDYETFFIECLKIDCEFLEIEYIQV